MTSEKQITEILQSKSQLRLYGYQNYFKSFIKLHKENRLPNIVLLSGPKGLGKSTFAYHFINYLLSQNEKYEYSVENFQINPKNYTFNQIQNYIHPNFFLLEDNQSEENIKIDKIRSLIKFLNKSTYAKNLKITLKMDEHNSDALYKLGVSYLNLNKKREAKKILNKLYYLDEIQYNALKTMINS